jgi:hypothetical protein
MNLLNFFIDLIFGKKKKGGDEKMLRDLKARIPGAHNFYYWEFLKSDTAMRLGIVQKPTEEQWQNIEKLAVNILQPVRDHFGRTNLTSGFRCPELCLAIGSYKELEDGTKIVTSNHQRGEAGDIEPDDPTIPLIDIVNFIYNECDFRELIAEYFPGGWVHAAYREGGNYRILKLKDPKHNYKKVTIEYLNSIYKNEK